MTWSLITGGAKGVGKEIAIALAKNGYHVALHYRTCHKEAKTTAKEIEKIGGHCCLFQSDFSTVEGVEQFLTEYEKYRFKIKVLINNVGPYLEANVSTIDTAALQHLYQTNVFTPFILIRRLLHSLKKEEGSIISMGFPGVESLRVSAKASAYAMTKQSLYFLTRSLAKELQHDRVRVNMISPGYLEHSIVAPDSFKLPQGRFISFHEIASLVIYLCSEKAKGITGENITVGGGIGL